MKNLFVTTALVGCLASTASADPTVMLGFAFNLGGAQSQQLGLTAKVLSDDQQDTWVGAAGVTYFPKTNAWGLDAGIGYNFEHESATLTYDFVNQGIQFSAGWADLAEDEPEIDESI